jgi:tetratricopeptide (TPR) repeat protein
LEARIADARGDAAALERGALRQLEICRESGDLEGQAFAHKNLANVVWYRFDVAANREHTERALALFERLQQPLEIAYAIMNRGALASDLGDFEAADAAMSAAREIADGLGNPHLDCIIKANVALNASAAGLHERARELALDAFAFATEHELEVERYILMECLGHCERELGHFEAADALFEPALRWRRERDPRALMETLIEVIPNYVALGSIDRAVAAADELLLGIAQDRMIVHYPAQALATAAAAYAAAGDMERARSVRREAQALLRELAGQLPGERERNGYLSLRVHAGIFETEESGTARG